MKRQKKTWLEVIEAKAKSKWDEKRIARLASYAEREELDPAYVSSFRDVEELEGNYLAWIHSPKPRKHLSARRAGSLHRLLRYIDLKRELASPGLCLSPDMNLEKLKKTALGTNPFSRDEVVEVTLTFAVDKNSEAFQWLDIQDIPAHIPLSRWLKRVASALETDTPHTNGEKVHAEVQHYASAEAWKTERVMGHYRAGEELLRGVPAVIEIPPSFGGAVDTTLVVLEPELPPEELKRIWDNSRVSERAVKEFYPIWLEAAKAARAETDSIVFEEFWEYFIAQVSSLVEQNDQEFKSLSEGDVPERLLEYVPEYANAFRAARYAALMEARLAGQSLEEKEDAIRKLKLSEKRARSYSFEQEVLGRIAFEVCQGGLWFGDKGFSSAVWEIYKEQARTYGLEPDYYTDDPRIALDRIGRYLRKTERKIKLEFGRSSPFRRNP